MELLRKVDKRMLILAGALCAMHSGAQDLTIRFPVPLSAVLASLLKAGVSVNPAQIQMPQNLTATSNQIVLKITTAELMSDGHLRIRFSCQELGACQPFFASAGVTPGTEMAALGSLRAATSSEKLPATRHPPLVQAGAEAQLVLHDEHMWITIPVLTIDTGVAGAEVRVSSLDRKRIFRAFVVSPGVVRGVLP